MISKMKYERLNGERLNEMVDLMARCNAKDEQYIAYCCKKKESILADMKELLTYNETCIIGAIEDETLRGVMALDVDVPKERAEVVAFFIDTDDRALWQQIAQEMLVYIQEGSKGISKYLFFIGMYNENMITFLERNHATFKGNEFGLVLNREDYSQRLKDWKEEVGELEEKLYTEFIALHDGIFPGTYYSGDEIIERVDTSNKVFIDGKNAIRGYCYAEKEQDTEGGYIHFLGVAEENRRQGIGRRLISIASEWLLNENADKINMTVEADNQKALDLYLSLGYKIKSENKSYHYEVR